MFRFLPFCVMLMRKSRESLVVSYNSNNFVRENNYNDNMKKILLGLMALVAFSCFTSCKDDDDRDLAIVLSGEWEGDFGAYYTRDFKGDREIVRASYSQLVFTPRHEYSKSGYGTEADVYVRNSREKDIYTYNFRWEVEDGVIYIEFVGYDDIDDLVLDDYKMDSSYFTGKLNGKSFRLEKMSSHYEWTPYDDFFTKKPDQPDPGHHIRDGRD